MDDFKPEIKIRDEQVGWCRRCGCIGYDFTRRWSENEFGEEKREFICEKPTNRVVVQMTEKDLKEKKETCRKQRQLIVEVNKNRKEVGLSPLPVPPMTIEAPAFGAHTEKCGCTVILCRSILVPATAEDEMKYKEIQKEVEEEVEYFNFDRHLFR